MLISEIKNLLFYLKNDNNLLLFIHRYDIIVKKIKDSKYFFNIAYCYSMLKDDIKALRYFNLAWALDNLDTDCERAIKLIATKIKKQ